MRLRTPALAVALLLAGINGAAGGPTLPYGVSVAVEWGEPVGPESIRDQLEQTLARELIARGCFESVLAQQHQAPADLRLQVLVGGYEEETEFEYALAQAGAPDLDTERLRIAHVEAEFVVEIVELERGTVVRTRSFRHRTSYRPTWNEDPRAEAQRQLVDEVTRSIRKLACKGSAARWSREIDRARQGVASGARR